MKAFLALFPLVILLTACGAPSKDDFVTKAEEAGEFEIGSSRLSQRTSPKIPASNNSPIR